MTTKIKVIIASVALMASFASGRWLAPTKVVTVTKTVEVEKKVDVEHTQVVDHTQTTTQEVDKPDGSKQITTTVSDNVITGTQSNDSLNVSMESESKKEVTRDSSKVTLSALGSVNLKSLTSAPISYGLMVSKPILGPISVSGFGLSNGQVGIGVGLTF